MTNLEWIRQAPVEDLALRLMCPYDLEVEDYENLPCVHDEKLSNLTECHACLVKWLEREKGAAYCTDCRYFDSGRCVREDSGHYTGIVNPWDGCNKHEKQK